LKKTFVFILLLIATKTLAQKTLVSFNIGEQMAKIPNTGFSKYTLKPGFGIGISGIYITKVGIYTGINVSVCRLQVVEHTHYTTSWGGVYNHDSRSVISFGQLAFDATVGYNFDLNGSALSLGAMAGYVGNGTSDGLRYGLDARFTHEITRHFALGLDCNALLYSGESYSYLRSLASFGTYANFYWYF